MKFHLQPTSGHTITGFGPGWVRIGSSEYRENLLFDAKMLRIGWAAAGFEGLTEADFALTLELQPEIVLIGTGRRQRFPNPQLYRALTAARIGVEIMDTAAACRTYNIIAGEGRRVAAALIIAS